MKDRFRKNGEPPLPGDSPNLTTDIYILAAHFVLVAVLFGLALYFGLSIPSMAFGIVLAIALYSLFWRWRYGFWPD